MTPHQIDLVQSSFAKISPLGDDAGRIFDPFFQGRRQPATAREGSGVGLSIVREYVQAHGGRVALVSGERGAHFRIELPLSV